MKQNFFVALVAAVTLGGLLIFCWFLLANPDVTHKQDHESVSSSSREELAKPVLVLTESRDKGDSDPEVDLESPEEEQVATSEREEKPLSDPGYTDRYWPELMLESRQRAIMRSSVDDLERDSAFNPGAVRLTPEERGWLGSLLRERRAEISVHQRAVAQEHARINAILIGGGEFESVPVSAEGELIKPAPDWAGQRVGLISRGGNWISTRIEPGDQPGLDRLFREEYVLVSALGGEIEDFFLAPREAK